MHLVSWKARRAGGRITVTGKDEAGAEQKIVGVDRITPAAWKNAGYVLAVDKNDETHRLSV